MAQPLSKKLDWELANSIWAQTLNPIIANPMNQVQILSNLNLISGVNVINHGLGRLMKGWFLTDIQGICDLYRSAPLNELTLTLTSDRDVIVNLGVF